MTWTLRDLEPLLRASENEWRWHAAKVIGEIPRGHLASYGTIARVTNQRTGLNITGRNVAWLRKHIYVITNRDVTLPLHRVAKVGDRRFSTDSRKTQRTHRAVREQEGLYDDPPWWDPA